MIEGKFYTVSEVASRIGLTNHGTRERLRRGKIVGIKVGRYWLIPEEQSNSWTTNVADWIIEARNEWIERWVA